jgi:hypothetical protein
METKYTRDECINILDEYINLIITDEPTRDALIKQIAMLRCSDMEMANGNELYMEIQHTVMRGASMGKIY